MNLISEKRVVAICHYQLYQRRMTKSYDKKVRPRGFHEGDLIFYKILHLPREDQSKWTSNNKGPYVVKKAFSGGALLLLPHVCGVAAKTSTLKILSLMWQMLGDKEFLSLIHGKMEWESPPSVLVTRNPDWSQRSNTGTGCVKGRY
jgi:hypothetical protein